MTHRTVEDGVRPASTSTRCQVCGASAPDVRSEDDRRGQRRLAAIARAASSVADAGSLSVTLDVVAREVVQAEHIAAVQILRVEGGTMRVLGKAGFTDAEDFTDRLEECRTLGARMMFVEAFRTRRRVVVRHRKAAVLADPAWAPLHAIMGAPSWDSFVAVPLMVRGRAVGVMNAYYEPGESLNPAALEFLDAMADQAAMAVDSADLLASSRHDAQLAERARLARELHDSVVQQVFSMRMQAKALRARVGKDHTGGGDQVRSVADELLQLAQDALADLRSLVLQLHPVELVERGLADAIRAHAESTRSLSRLSIDVQLDAEGRLARLPEQLQEDVYRIVQEALHNVIKHANARRATIRIASGSDQLLVEISDDGNGLPDPVPRAETLGLRSMRERARHWGGRLEVDNARPGCLVRVSIPTGFAGGAR